MGLEKFRKENKNKKDTYVNVSVVINELITKSNRYGALYEDYVNDKAFFEVGRREV